MTQSPIIDKSLQAALASAPVVLWAVDTAGVIQQSTGKGFARQGLISRKVVGQSIFELYRDYPEFLANIRRALAGESVQFVLETVDGIFDRRLEPLRDDIGTITGVVGVSVDVTDQHRAQQALRRSEEQFRNLVEGSIQGLAIVQDQKLVFANEAMAATFGFPSVQALVQDFVLESLFDANIAQRVRSNIDRRLKGEAVPPQWQTQGQKLDGSPLWIEVMARVATWQGKPAVQIAFSDITARKHSELQLQRREEQYRDLLEGSLQGVVIRRNHRTLFANDAFARLLGYASGAEVLPLANADFMPPQEVARRAEETARRERGEPVSDTFELELMRKDGGIATCMAFRRQVQWEGEPAWQITMIDITDRKRIEMRLRQSEEQFRALTEGSLQGIVIHRDRKYLFANQAYANLLGLPSPEAVYALASMDEIVAPEERERMNDYARRRMAGEKIPQVYETASMLPDGTRVPVLVFSSIVQWQGKPAIQSTLIDMTERKRAEQALRESEWQLKRAQQAAHIGTWYREIDTGLTHWSDEFYHLLGLAPGSVPATSERFFEVVHPEDLENYKHRRFQAQEMEGHLSIDLRIVRPNGDVRLMRIVADRVDSEEGRPLALVGTLEDITDRHAAEVALRESEQRFRDLVEGSLQGIVILRHGLVLFANAAYLRMFGYDSLQQAQAEGTTLNRVPEYERERLKRYAKARSRGESVPSMYEMDCLRRDGTLFSVFAMVRTVQWDGVSALQITAIDITDQRRLEKSLRLKDHAIRSANEAIAFGDLQGKILEVNPAFVKMWGLQGPNEAIGRRAIEFWWTARDLERATEAIGAGGGWIGETVGIRPNGETFPVDVRVSTVRDDDGKAVWLMASIVDITERKKTDERQRELEEQLFQAQKMESIGRLVGGIAHDFNNMLTPMLGYAELAIAALDPKDPSRRHVQVIRSAAERAADLTRKLLLFGRRRPLRKALVEIGPEIQNVVDMLQRVIDASTTIEPQISRDVGQIEADPALVHQLIMNLALNARDAMPEGGKLVIAADRVTLAPEANRPGELPPGPYVRISVQDTGHGMDPDTMARIFDPFFTTKPEGKGTGLGLSVVYGIVSQHGGHIAVNSKPGAGTTFVVYLPAPPVAAVATAFANQPAKPHRSATVLVVEDDPLVLGLVSAILSGQGYTLLEAKGPDDALRLLDARKAPVDLLLCDVVLPKINGPALAAQVAGRSPSTRVVFMSGYTKDVAVEHGMQEQNATLLDKPFTVDGLTRAVRAALERP